MATVDAEPYGFEFEPATTALLMIDFQRDFVYPGGFGEALGNDTSPLLKALPPAERVLKACRAAGIFVIHTREGHRADLSDLPPSKKVRGHGKITIGDVGPMGRILVRASRATTSSRRSTRSRVSPSSTSRARVPSTRRTSMRS